MLLPRFGLVPINGITIEDVDRWWARHADHPVNRRNAYYILRPIMSSAVRYGLVKDSPCKIENAGADVAQRRPDHSFEDFRAAVEQLSEEFKTPIALAFGAHLRIGELVGLNRSDYTRDTGVLLVVRQYAGAATKTRSRKQITVLSIGRTAVEKHLDDNSAPGHAPMFPGIHGGRLSATKVRQAWKKATTAAGFDNFRFHDIRHVSLTTVGQSGAGIRDLMTRAGHSTPAAALRYQHGSQVRDAEVAELVDQRIKSL
jgi:integrase